MFHASLIISSDSANRLNYTQLQVARYKINKIDIKLYQDSPFTITNVRELIFFLSRAPFASPFKAAIINSATLTPESQQALLKTFEEPPAHSLLFLLSNTIDSLLPTLVSRCRVVILPQTETKPNQIDTTFWKKIMALPLGERLREATALTKDKETLNEWLTTHIILLQNSLIDTYNKGSHYSPKEQVFLLKKLAQTRQLLKQNVSQKLAFDQLLLSLPFKK